MPVAMPRQTSEFMFSTVATHLLAVQRGFRGQSCLFLWRSATDGSCLGKDSICEYEKAVLIVAPCELQGDVGLTDIVQPWT
jgi:hypothetical protein